VAFNVCHDGLSFPKIIPRVLVAQTRQDRDGDNDAGPLDRPTQGRILAQCQKHRSNPALDNLQSEEGTAVIVHCLGGVTR
jgi:hypothetical protein